MTTKRLVRIAFFTMLTIVGGLIRIPIPFTPINITLQTLFVIASGMILGGKDGAFAQIAYMILGLIGIPVFTTGGGPSYVFQPSFGYILSFPLAALVSGVLVRRLRKLTSWKLFLCAVAGIVSNYIVGITYQVLILYIYSGSTFAAAIGTVPAVLLMLVKDMALAYLLCLLYPRIMTMIGKTDEQNKKPVSVIMPPEEPKVPEGEEPTKPREPKQPPRKPEPEPSPIIPQK